MNEMFICPDNRQFRLEFYGAKWDSYFARFPGQWPTRATVQRWVKECNEAILAHNTTRFCSEMADEL